jgi:hypothetical protein
MFVLYFSMLQLMIYYGFVKPFVTTHERAMQSPEGQALMQSLEALVAKMEEMVKIWVTFVKPWFDGWPDDPFVYAGGAVAVLFSVGVVNEECKHRALAAHAAQHAAVMAQIAVAAAAEQAARAAESEDTDGWSDESE